MDQFQDNHMLSKRTDQNDSTYINFRKCKLTYNIEVGSVLPSERIGILQRGVSIFGGVLGMPTILILVIVSYVSHNSYRSYRLKQYSACLTSVNP
jgi:hypothetical protein